MVSIIEWVKRVLRNLGGTNEKVRMKEEVVAKLSRTKEGEERK
jgi:hypothetical protein